MNPLREETLFSSSFRNWVEVMHILLDAGKSPLGLWCDSSPRIPPASMESRSTFCTIGHPFMRKYRENFFILWVQVVELCSKLTFCSHKCPILCNADVYPQPLAMYRRWIVYCIHLMFSFRQGRSSYQPNRNKETILSTKWTSFFTISHFLLPNPLLTHHHHTNNIHHTLTIITHIIPLSP